MENTAYIEKIHRYLSGGMKDGERAGFESEMNQNSSLREDVSAERQLLAGIRLAGDNDLRKSISAAHRSFPGSKNFRREERSETAKIIPLHSTHKKFAMKNVLAIAASILFISGAAWWIFYRTGTQTPDTNAAFQQYFKPETTLAKEVEKSLESYGLAPKTNAQDSLREALKLYNDSKYDETCAALDSFLAHHPANDTAQFFLAMAHLNQSRYGKSVELLTPLSTLEGSAFQLDAKWYLALAYLMTEKGLDKSKTILTELSKNAKYKDRQSTQGVLELLDYLWHG